MATKKYSVRSFSPAKPPSAHVKAVPKLKAIKSVKFKAPKFSSKKITPKK